MKLHKLHALLFALITILLFSCQKEKITLSTNVHETFFLNSKGNNMPIQVHGNTASKTFMLIIHGGPGSSSLAYRTPEVKSMLEPNMAVVYWDQRYAWVAQGNTELSEAKFEDVVNDMEQVVGLLKQRYGSDISLFVNGHSWGGFLTPEFLVKGNNQNTVKGWIHTDGVHDAVLLNKLLIEKYVEKANIEIAANRNVAKWKEIRDYALSVTLPANEAQNEQLNNYSRVAVGITPEVIATNNIDLINNYIGTDGPLTAGITAASIRPQSGSYNYKLFNKLSQGTDLPNKLPLITIPSLIVFGEWDYNCPPKLADDVMARISSTYKKKIIYPNTEHNPMFNADKVQYWADVKEFINKFK
jgi:proline iminopeptidase